MKALIQSVAVASLGALAAFIVVREYKRATEAKPKTTGDFARMDRAAAQPAPNATTGDFARLDRTAASEVTVADPQYREYAWIL